MKKLLFITLTILFIAGSNNGYSQEIPEGGIRLDANTIIKDETGKIVELHEAFELTQSGKYEMIPVNDSDGKLKYFQLERRTNKDMKDMAQMSSKEIGSDLIEKSIPNFSLVDLNGNIISSENTKGKVVVLNFWFASCKPCIAEVPELNEVYESFKEDSNVVFASITFENREQVNSFLKKHPLKYPVVSDAKDICDLFNIIGYPTNIVIDKEGKYSDYIAGGNSEIGQRISNSIQDALDNTVIQNSNNIMLDPNATFKLENGDIIPFNKATEMLSSNKYQIVKQKDPDNNEYYLIKKK